MIQPASPVPFHFGFGTDIGRKRAQNQDCGLALPEAGLFLVADGMGGHRGGETASQLAVEMIRDTVLRNQAAGQWNARHTLSEAIQNANRAIFTLAQQKPELEGMGTTVTALLFQGLHLVVGHVGDSRCYLTRDRQIWQVTRDHSLVQEKFRAGLITREELKTDQMKNVITRSVGYEPQTAIDLYELDTTSGDLFLICSDGLSSQVDDPRILEILAQIHGEVPDQTRDPSNETPPAGIRGDIAREGRAETSLQAHISRLIQSANDTGGLDNITAILIQCALASPGVSP